MVAINNAETANVTPFARNAIQAGATVSKIAPIAGPSRVSPTKRGRIASAAGLSAQAAADARVVNAITSVTGPVLATVTARAAMSSMRRESPASSTVRRR